MMCGMENVISYMINGVNRILVQPCGFSQNPLWSHNPKAHCFLCPFRNCLQSIIIGYNRQTDITIILKIDIYVFAFCQLNGCINFKPITSMLKIHIKCLKTLKSITFSTRHINQHVFNIKKKKITCVKISMY